MPSSLNPWKRKMSAAPRGRSKQVRFKWIFQFSKPICRRSNHQPETDWLVVPNIFYFHPYLGKISILTNIFQRGWNHQLAEVESNHPQFPFGPFFRLAFLKGHLPPLRCRVWGAGFDERPKYVHIYIHIYVDIWTYAYIWQICIYIYTYSWAHACI